MALALPEPELQHAALRVTARGWETLPLPAPDGSGALVAALDLHTHEAAAEHSDGRSARVALTPDRRVGEVTRELLEYETAQVEAYFDAATRAALVLAEFRAPYRGRSTPVNAWWGSLDLAVNLFSGAPADPPSDDFIMRNSMDAQEVAVGWWPGNARLGRAAFFAFAPPAPEGCADGIVAPGAAHWDPELALFALDWDDVRASSDPHGTALEFARSAFHHACIVCDWDPALLASAEGSPPAIH